MCTSLRSPAGVIMTDLKPKIATSSSKEKEKMKQKQKQQQSSSSKIKSAVAAVPSGRGRSSKQRKGAAGTRRRSFVNDTDRQTLEQKPPVDTNAATTDHTETSAESKQ